MTISVPDAEKFPVAWITEQIENILSGSKTAKPAAPTHEEVSYSLYNRFLHQEASSLWKGEHQAQHQTAKTQARERKKQEAIHRQARTLATKGLKTEEVAIYAERDVAIIAGEKRTKHSMRSS